MKRDDWPKEIRKDRIYGNFRDTSKKKAARKSAQARREGNCEKHRELIRKLPCCIPGCTAQPPVHIHHLKSGAAKGERAFGRKSTDQRGVPLCYRHHINGVETVQPSEEVAWFQDHGIDDVHALAKRLWEGPRTVPGLTAIVYEARGDYTIP